MSLRICMIGCGAFARVCHGPAQRRCSVEDPTVELAGCCDPAAERAREYAGAFGFGRHYTDLPAMLTAERPDAVVVAVPPAMTCRIASLVLERGIWVLIEKPPGMTTAELGQLTAAAEKAAETRRLPSTAATCQSCARRGKFSTPNFIVRPWRGLNTE